MSFSELMRERGGDVPPRLAVRVDEIVGEASAVKGSEATPVCLQAADAALRDLLARESAGREAALDLLTVDALVTYAFEAAASQPTTLREHAAAAAVRFAAAVEN